MSFMLVMVHKAGLDVVYALYQMMQNANKRTPTAQGEALTD